MTERDWAAERFEEHRPRLRAIAHRILGSPSEADDAVQEAWLRFSRSTPAASTASAPGWTTVVSRVCLNMLQARTTHAQPVAGPAPPEPRAEPAESDPEYEALLADSVGHALLVVLDTLTPAERVAFVLHDVFAIPFEEIAPIVGRSGPCRPATRQPGPRACGGRTPAPARPAPSCRAGRRLPRRRARGRLDALLRVLAPDVVLRADRHAVELGAPEERRGREPVATFSRRARGARRALLDGAAAAVLDAGRPAAGRLLLHHCRRRHHRDRPRRRSRPRPAHGSSSSSQRDRDGVGRAVDAHQSAVLAGHVSALGAGGRESAGELDRPRTGAAAPRDPQLLPAAIDLEDWRLSAPLASGIVTVAPGPSAGGWTSRVTPSA